jgi:hypothetical protein
MESTGEVLQPVISGLEFSAGMSFETSEKYGDETSNNGDSINTRLNASECPESR